MRGAASLDSQVADSSPMGAWGLAVAHPGHELRLGDWLAETRPVTFVLTTGSRSGADRGRIEASGSLADRIGAERGGIFGRYLDSQLYSLMIAGDVPEMMLQ